MSTPIKRRVNADRRRQGRIAGQAAPATEASPRPEAPCAPFTLQRLLTVELVAYGAIFILGFAIRLAHLDSLPLEVGEATRALGGWQLIRGEVPMSWQEPLVVLSAALSFFALGDNDIMARLLPTAIGSTMVLLPWLIRTRLGGFGAIMASLFLSISPTFVFYSRTLSGDVFAAALSLGLLICIVRYIDEKKSHWAVAGAGLIALLLNTGAPGMSTLLVFAVFFALLGALGKNSNEYALAWKSFREDKETVKQSSMVLLGGFVLVGSGFLSGLSGLNLPALSVWIAEFNLVPNSRPWYYHFQLLVGYEPLITLFGVAAVIYYVHLWQKRQGRQALGFKGLLMFWAVASLALGAFAASKDGGQLIGSALSLTLLSGVLVGELVARIDRRLTVAGEGPLLVAAPFLVYAFLVAADLTRKGQLVFWYQWTLALLALVMASTMIAASIVHGGSRVARRAALIGLVLLLGYSVHTTWRTAFAASEDQALAASNTSRSLVDAVAEVDQVAASKFLGKGIGVAVEPDLRLPIQWYLRNYTAVQYTTSIQPGTQVIFWPVETPPDIKLEDYFARKVVSTTNWTGEAADLGGLWRWLMLGESPEKRKSVPVMLYLHK